MLIYCFLVAHIVLKLIQEKLYDYVYGEFAMVVDFADQSTLLIPRGTGVVAILLQLSEYLRDLGEIVDLVYQEIVYAGI